MKKLNISKYFLIKRYIKNKKSMSSIAKQINCSEPTIFNYLKKYNIKRRTVLESLNLEETKKKISKSLRKLYKKNSQSWIEGGKKISKILKKLHNLYPERWKRNTKERKLMSLRMKKYIKQHPNFIKKRIKEMIKVNKNRKYPKKTLQEKIKFTKFIKKYFKTHKVWNKGLKTGLVPKTVFKKGNIPYNKNLPSYLQPMFGKRGKLHPAYIHGKGYEPYSPKFTQELKDSIRKRDNYQCQLCNKSQRQEVKQINRKLSIHHIDYNKENYKEDNLITLCNNCNPKINFNRDYWFAYFIYIIEHKLVGLLK